MPIALKWLVENYTNPEIKGNEWITYIEPHQNQLAPKYKKQKLFFHYTRLQVPILHFYPQKVLEAMHDM